MLIYILDSIKNKQRENIMEDIDDIEQVKSPEFTQVDEDTVHAELIGEQALDGALGIESPDHTEVDPASTVETTTDNTEQIEISIGDRILALQKQVDEADAQNSTGYEYYRAKQQIGELRFELSLGEMSKEDLVKLALEYALKNRRLERGKSSGPTYSVTARKLGGM